jgi:signal transduction histidine kinase
MTANDTGRFLGAFPEGRKSIALQTESAVGIIHDLGNMIQIASAAVNIVARDPGANPADLEPVIAGARASLERAGALVRQTIGMMSERATAAEQVSLAAVLSEVESLVQVTWGNCIQLDVWASPDLPTVKCDQLALQNVVLNLLFNARDAMPDGGVISIRAETISLDSGAPIELRVADSGIGMKPDTVVQAFDPFFTTKADGLGGVGLPMVERFVQQMGGSVHIESEYGIGTTVKLLLPASSQPPGPCEHGDSKASQFPSRRPIPIQERDQ